jgi:cytochrome P450
MTACARDHGDIVHCRVLGMSAFLLNHPDDVEHVLLTRAKNYLKGFKRQRTNSPFGQGLLLSDGSVWQRQRRLMQPPFNKSAIAAHSDAMRVGVQDHLQSWASGEVRVIDHEMKTLTLKVFLRMLVGSEESYDIRGLERVFEGLEEHFDRVFSSPIQLPAWAPTPGNRHFRRSLGQLDARISELIRVRREQPSDDLLSFIIRSADREDGISDALLHDEVLSLFLAGHETTALCLTYTLYLLAKHPEVEGRLAEECQSVLGDRPPSITNLHAMPYAAQVVTESLRLYPPIYAMVREPLEDDTIRGYSVPAGSLVVLPQWVIQRDARFFDEPEEFRPERWTEDFSRQLPRFAYFPFGGGARLCIGNHLALMETALLLVSLVQRYRFERLAEEPLELACAITMRPKRAVKLRVTAR